LDGLDVQVRHAGIKPRNRTNEKREGAEPLTRISLITTNSNALKILSGQAPAYVVNILPQT
jgi:hypothetical protein